MVLQQLLQEYQIQVQVEEEVDLKEIIMDNQELEVRVL